MEHHCILYTFRLPMFLKALLLWLLDYLFANKGPIFLVCGDSKWQLAIGYLLCSCSLRVVGSLPPPSVQTIPPPSVQTYARVVTVRMVGICHGVLVLKCTNILLYMSVCVFFNFNFFWEVGMLGSNFETEGYLSKCNGSCFRWFLMNKRFGN